MIETRHQNTATPRVIVEERRHDPFPAWLVALGFCACIGSGALLALLIVMVT